MSRAERASIEAAEWLIAQEDGPLTPDERARLDAWLAASDGNKAAYWRLQYGWEQADRVGSLGRAAAADRAPARRFATRRWWLPPAIAAAIALAFGFHQFGGEPSPYAPERAERAALATEKSYSTPIGGKRLVGLADGSRIQLNTQSKVRARITPAQRQIWLDQGEAFFEVAHHDNQPFIVHAGDRQITVLGTKFAVRRDGAKVTVTVLEGRVRVDEMQDDRLLRSSIIVGGDIAMAEGAATLVTARSEERVESALSWRTGMLSFDEMPLPAIAAEFNRYNRRKIVLQGSAVGAIRITGTFPSGKPDAFARLLRDAYGLDVESTEDEIRVSR